MYRLNAHPYFSMPSVIIPDPLDFITTHFALPDLLFFVSYKTGRRPTGNGGPLPLIL
jgi:hypothetical protein